jgi:hypothetical protein
VNPQKAFRGRFAWFAAGAAGIAILLFAYYAVTWRNFAGFTRAIEVCEELFCDFIIYYYPMGEEVFRTGLPVDGFLYSPFIAVLLAVFPPLGLTASLLLWGILQVVFVFLYLLLFRRLVPAGLRIQLLFVALTLSSFPLLLNLLAGQVSVFMIVGILGLLVLDERGHRASGAGLLAFAASFKFYPMMFVLPFAARRDVGFVLLAVTACGVFLVVVPGVFLGVGDALHFYGALLDSFRDSDWVTANPHSQFLPHYVLRWVDVAENNVHAYLPLLHWIAYVVAAVNIGLIFLVQRARPHHTDLWSFQIVFMTIPFVLKTSWPHDFIYLPFTQTFLVWHLLEGDAAGQRSRARMAVMFILLLPSIFLSNIVLFNVLGDFTRYGFYGFLFWSNLLLLIAAYVQLLPPALRRPRML